MADIVARNADALLRDIQGDSVDALFVGSGTLRLSNRAGDILSENVVVGAKGPAGDKGASGLPGPAGDPGDKGPTGPPGYPTQVYPHYTTVVSVTINTAGTPNYTELRSPKIDVLNDPIVLVTPLTSNLATQGGTRTTGVTGCSASIGSDPANPMGRVIYIRAVARSTGAYNFRVFVLEAGTGV